MRNAFAGDDLKERSGVWLASEEARHFAAYAHLVGLKAPSLASVLIVRAVHLGVLPEDAIDFPSPGASSLRRRITLPGHSQEHALRFEHLASTTGISFDAGLRLLIATELRDRWLAQAMGVESS
ncbi:hypothetical protein [Novosphingobium kaempferiae]|uniref:hypothetical protein n=1 Tax=Novosphingobium kaempferiae TaxID=2896849 RepID=UPI001E2C4E61|nr:hypothetical protein [Novosphingobium kaempferiae]